MVLGETIGKTASLTILEVCIFASAYASIIVEEPLVSVVVPYAVQAAELIPMVDGLKTYSCIC